MYHYLKTITAVSLFLSISLMADSVEPKTVACKVTEVSPHFNSFFGLQHGQAPVAGDLIDIALDGNEIGDLTFKSGATVPLKKVGATLQKQQTETGYQSYFVGKHKSPTSDYVGILGLYHNNEEKKSSGTLQILRHRTMGFMELHQLELDCTQP